MFQLSALDLSWCEEVEEAGLNQLLALCPLLTTLSLRCCPVTPRTLLVLAQSCTAIQQLDISGATELEDDGIVCLAKALRNLTILDLSRNCGKGWLVKRIGADWSVDWLRVLRMSGVSLWASG